MLAHLNLFSALEEGLKAAEVGAVVRPEHIKNNFNVKRRSKRIALTAATICLVLSVPNLLVND